MLLRCNCSASPWRREHERRKRPSRCSSSGAARLGVSRAQGMAEQNSARRNGGWPIPRAELMKRSARDVISGACVLGERDG